MGPGCKARQRASSKERKRRRWRKSNKSFWMVMKRQMTDADGVPTAAAGALTNKH